MPARLIYNPRAYVYTKRQDGSVLNLTPWVTSGNVNRLLDQVSSATVTLRNPQRRFTTPSTGVAFHPMDPITIYLERIEGKPVQVFTGYLDVTPYYQLFPGTITLQASCTLKRILYTWFDPSLPYVISFFTKYGWLNTGQGSIINPNAIGGPTQAQATNLQDSSIGKLLWATLYEIGEWQDANIWIENLPNGIAQRMEQLMQSMQAAQQTATDDFTTFLNNVIGAGSQGSGAGASSQGTGQVWQVKASAEQDSSGPAQIAGAGLWGPTQDKLSGKTASQWGGAGYTELSTKTLYGSGTFDTLGKMYPRGTLMDITYNGKTVTLPLSDYGTGSSFGPTIGITASAQNLLGIPQGGNSTVEIQLTGGASLSLPARFGTLVSQGANAVGGAAGKAAGAVGASAVGGGKSALGNIIPYGTKNVLIERTDMGVDFSIPDGTSVGAIQSGTFKIACTSCFAGQPFYSVILDTPINGFKAWYIAEGVANPIADGTRVTAGQHICVIQSHGTGIETGWATPDGLNAIARSQFDGSNPTPDGSNFANYIGVPVLNNTSQPLDWSKLTPGANTGSGGTTGGASGSTTSTNTADAFVAELQFPSIEDQVTAIALGAEHKGLMHDQNLLPFIQQLTQASLRSFQSLPNGDFFAFYPDFFGEFGHRPPYWLIDDIELLDGRIDLSDDSLATHVFAVGDNCLALDTLIPTPTGWTTMGDLQIGEWVFGSDGIPTQVLTASQTHYDHPCYRVTFEDGHTIITDDAHRWETRTFRHNKKRAINDDRQLGVYTTEEIADNLYITTDHEHDWGRFNHRVKVTQPLTLSEQDLPIDPYLFGYWLGDGERGHMRITVDTNDCDHLIEQIAAAGYRYNASLTTTTGYGTGKHWRITILGQRQKLRKLDVLNNKHIPSMYLRASYAQRLALLQGLMDSDGSFSNYCENHQSDPALAKDLRELICSLGFRANCSITPARNGSLSQFAIEFAPQSHCNVFRLPRKADAYMQRVNNRKTTTSQYRAIVSVESIDSVPVKCIGVATDDHLYLVGEGMIPTHNTWPVNDELLNMLFSAGNINIFNAFLTPGLINTKQPTGGTGKNSRQQQSTGPFKDGRIDSTKNTGMQSIMTAAEAVEFIKRYGARPLVQNYPMVHSNLFEMLLAYQQFMFAWANQFKTPFSFTFMPELYPGGKVGFPNHGIQMYIQSVTHSWDYEDGVGFTTQAELSAPSVLVQQDGTPVDISQFPDIPPNMVEALVEPIRQGPPGSQGQSQTLKHIAQTEGNYYDTYGGSGVRGRQ